MKTRAKIVVTVFALLATSFAASAALSLTAQPDDTAVVLGVLFLAMLVIVVPSVLHGIWNVPKPKEGK